MTINPAMLRLRRLRARMSQHELAQIAKVNRRTISRIENGEKARVRHLTIKSLAKALNCSPEQLASAPDEGDHPAREQDEFGGRKVSAYLDASTALAMDLVEKRYGISIEGQIEMAPLFTVLLAETCLAERKQRLEQAKVAFEQSLSCMPGYLFSITDARARFDEGCLWETRSVAARDLFGRIPSDDEAVEEEEEAFDTSMTNPFCDFLDETVERLSEEEDRLVSLILPGRDGLPMEPNVLWDYCCHQVCADNVWAIMALIKGKVRVADIPHELWSDSRRVERGKWLESQYPAEEREKQQESSRISLVSSRKSDG